MLLLFFIIRCAKLTHLKAGALAGLGRLRTFSIRDSALMHIHHSVFTHLSRLEELYLRNNRLGEQVYIQYDTKEAAIVE